VLGSIFFDVSLPNAATWLYFSFLLACAVFFRFDRLLILRNWDLVSLYLLVPGLLLVQEAHAVNAAIAPEFREGLSSIGRLDVERLNDDVQAAIDRRDGLLLIGYIWLLAGTAFWFGRCLFDLGLERRPSLGQNLNLPGLICLGAALLVCLTIVAVRRLPDSPQQVGRGPVAISKVKDGATAVVESQSPGNDRDRTATLVWVERCVTISLHLAVVSALVLIGAKHFRDPTTGVGMACLYLLIPYTAYHVSQVHHVWPAAIILWAILMYRRPAAAGAILGVAAGTAFFPFLMFPLWFGFYRGRGATRFATGFVTASGLSLALTAGLLLLSGELREHLRITLSLSDWQPWRAPHTEGIWQGTHWAYRLPVFIGYMAFVVLTAFWPTPRNFGQVIAQSAAVVIGVQFWYADQGGVYVLWYLPLVLLMVFRPNLTDVRPPLPQPYSGWISRLARAVDWTRRLGSRTHADLAA
jgi:hypothetical protein